MAGMWTDMPYLGSVQYRDDLYKIKSLLKMLLQGLYLKKSKMSLSFLYKALISGKFSYLQTYVQKTAS